MNENNANFTPDAPSFKKLVFMNMQKLTNFPYIEADFDALTNYELLSKVVEYLNEVIANNNEQNEVVEGLYNAYVSLQDYVNNYFDNLDVQDEINNKLDEMTQNGELTKIIKNYIDPAIEEIENDNQEFQTNLTNTINNRLDVQDTLINAATSGSPLTASSTAEMTDTTRVYVNTTNGKWYYYDGDSWEIGGTYQSTEIANDSIDVFMLNDELKDNFIIEPGEKIGTDNLTPGHPYIVNNAVQFVSGAEATNAGYYTISLEPGKIYEFIGDDYDIYVSGKRTVACIVVDNLGNIIFNTSSNSAKTVQGIFKCNASNLTMYVTIKNVSSSYYKYIQGCRVIESISNKLKTTNDALLLQTIDGYYATTSKSVSQNDDSKIFIYRMEKGKKYSIKYTDIYSVMGLIIYDITQTNILYQSSNSSVNPARTTTYEFTAEQDGWILLSKYQNYEYEMDCSNPNIDIISQQINISDKLTNILYQKEAVFDGDSICHGTSASDGLNGWAGRIGTANSMNWKNAGVSGGTITSGLYVYLLVEDISNLDWDNVNYYIKNNNATSASNLYSQVIEETWNHTDNLYTKSNARHWVSTNINSIYSSNPNLDYLILEGGTNDADIFGNNPNLLGEISKTYSYYTDFDPTHDFTQALEYLFSKAIALYPTKRIGFIVAQKMSINSSNYNTSNRKIYFNRCIEVAKKYGIPVLNLWDDCHLNNIVDYKSHNDSYYMYTDGQHLSSHGYNYVSPIIEEWMRTL